LLHDGRHVATDLHDLDDDDELARYYESSWFETCRITLDLLGEMLSLNDLILEDQITQPGGSRVIDEVNPSTRCRRKHR
jgi:hypothetical protein